MKKLLLFSLMLMTLTSCFVNKRVPIPVVFEKPIVKTYEVTGTKNELFVDVNRWMISIFKDARSVIQFSDKDEGILIGKYLLHEREYDPEIFAMIEIKVAEGKAQISISPYDWNYEKLIRYDGSEVNLEGTWLDGYNYTKEKAIADIENLFESFSKAIQIESK